MEQNTPGYQENKYLIGNAMQDIGKINSHSTLLNYLPPPAKHTNTHIHPHTITHPPDIGDLWSEGCNSLWCDIVAGDDFFEGVEEKILASRVGFNLREDEGEVLLQVAGTYTAYIGVYE